MAGKPLCYGLSLMNLGDFADARLVADLARSAEAAGWDAASQIQAMDDEGLDVAVLFPSRGLFVLGLDSVEQMGSDGLEGDYAAAIARAYNSWMADFVKEDPKRMFGAGLIAPHDPEGSTTGPGAASSTWMVCSAIWRASGRSPALKAGCPQQVCPLGKLTLAPARSRTRTTDSPVCG